MRVSRLAGEVHDAGLRECGMQRGWRGGGQTGDGLGVGIRGRPTPFGGEDPESCCRRVNPCDVWGLEARGGGHLGMGQRSWGFTRRRKMCEWRGTRDSDIQYTRVCCDNRAPVELERQSVVFRRQSQSSQDPSRERVTAPSEQARGRERGVGRLVADFVVFVVVIVAVAANGTKDQSTPEKREALEVGGLEE